MRANQEAKTLLSRASGVVKKTFPFVSTSELMKRQITHSSRILLDLGCGRGTSLFIELAQRKDIYLIGLDLFRPYLVQAKSIYHDVILADVRLLPIRGHSCDVTVGSQIIEHLAKDVIFIKRLEELSRKVVMISAPVGPNPKDQLEDNNPYQKHKSEWYPDELTKLGFKVWGCEGARFLRSERSQFKMHKTFYPFLFVLSVFTQFLTYKLVAASYQMLCVKQLVGNGRRKKHVILTCKGDSARRS